MFLWVAAASIPLPVPLTSAKGAESCKACPGKHLDPITDIASLNRWFSEVQALINAQLQWAPHIIGDCVKPTPWLSPDRNCSNAHAIYAFHKDHSDITIDWVSGIETLHIKEASARWTGPSKLAMTFSLEMGFLSLLVRGKICQPGLGCAHLEHPLTWGSRKCADEGEWCECEGGIVTVRSDDAEVRAPRSSSQHCIAAKESPASCYCQYPGTISARPRRLSLELGVECSERVDKLVVQTLEVGNWDMDVDIPVGLKRDRPEKCRWYYWCGFQQAGAPNIEW